MSKTISIPGGTIALAESNAVCPHCGVKIAFNDIERKWTKCKSVTMRMRCKCRRFIAITTDLKCDFVAFSLSKQTH